MTNQTSTQNLTADSVMCPHDYFQGIGCATCTAAAKEAQEAAERAAREERRVKEQEAYRAARIALVKPHYERLVALMPGCGTLENDGLSIKGHGFTLYISFDETRSASYGAGYGRSGRSTILGYRIVVGSYGERKNFPQRKDGTFNYKEIARLLVLEANKNKLDIEVQARRAGRAEAVKQLETELGLRYESKMVLSASPSENDACPVRVGVQFTVSVSPEKARAIHAALVSLGVLSK